MKLKVFISGLLLVACFQVQSQALIDLSKEEVKLIIKREYKDLAPDGRIVKQKYKNYLKFVNRKQTRTLIVYFKDDIAISSKLVCDYDEQEVVVAELDNNYTKVGENRWEYKNMNMAYMVELRDEEYYFTVRERKKEKI